MKRDHAAFLFHICVGIWVAMLGSACCKDCPPPQVKPPTVVEVPCKLPPVPVSLPVAKTVDACAPKLICYDVEGAVAVAERDAVLRQWVKEANARCRRKPASQPTERPDAGSPYH